MSGQGPTPAFSVKRASFGFLFGVLGGIGASIVLTQKGSLDIGLFWQVALVPCVLAAIWAGMKTPPLVDKLVQWVTAIIAIGSIFVAMLPASAQVRACQFAAWADLESTVNRVDVAAGERVEASRTTESGPWVIDLDKGNAIFFEISVGDEFGVGAIQLESASPLPLAQDDTYLWTGIVNGQAEDRMEILSRDVSGVVVESNGVQARVVEFGLMQIRGLVTDNSGNTICASTAWVRLVDEPFTNLVGLGGAGSLLVGTIGLIGLGRTKPTGRRPRKTKEDDKDRESGPTEQPGGIPPKGPHAYVESSLFDMSGQAVQPDIPLDPGREYRLEIRIKPELPDEQEDNNHAGSTVTVRVFGREFSIPKPKLSLEVGLPQGNLPSVILVAPDTTGSHPVHVQVLQDGQLLHLETLELSVGDVPTPAHSTTTRISTTQFTDAELDRRESRAAQIIVLRSDDDSVDLQVLGKTADPLITFDTPHQAEALLAVSRQTRERLTAVLEGTPNYRGVGKALEVDRGDLEQVLPDLAEAGAQLYNLLFGWGHIPGANSDQGARLASKLPSGSTIQINLDHAGIGVSTIPWGLVYDRSLFRSSETKTCPEFADHEPDACPHTADPTTVCPWGFWGYRYILEQPPAWAGQNLPPPLPATISNNRPLRVSFITDPAFPSEGEHQQQLEALTDLDLTRIETLAQLRESWHVNKDQFDVAHFFTHHAIDPQTGAPALVVGTERLTESSLDGLRLAWPGHPIVVLAGCATGAANSLEAPASLIGAFRRAKAAGVVATECTVRDAVAAGLVGAFLEKVFTGDSIGPALTETRRRALLDHNSPAGLAYSMYALSDLHLGEGGEGGEK